MTEYSITFLHESIS